MSATDAGFAGGTHAGGRSRLARLREYFWSDNPRRVQTLLGLVWLLDGGLQFQSFMYSKGFVQSLAAGAQGQPAWLASSVGWGARLADGNLDLWNTLFALTQVLIGLGLLYRPLVKPALAGSFLWVLIVWWFGEAFGMIFMATTPMGGAAMASALTGAPGGVLLYGLVGAIVWPGGGAGGGAGASAGGGASGHAGGGAGGRAGGLFGARGARLLWAGLWLVMAYLWLVEAGGANAITNAINAAPSGMSWLSSVQDWFADAAKGDGVAIALVFAAVSAVIGIAVGAGWRPQLFLALAIGLNLLYWVVGQGLGGIAAGGATDPNAGPLFVLLAYAMLPLVSNYRRT